MKVSFVSVVFQLQPWLGKLDFIRKVKKSASRKYNIFYILPLVEKN